MQPPKESGVYILTHEPTGVYYLGSTSNLYARYYKHRSSLKNGVHKNPKLNGVFTHWDDMQFEFELCGNAEEALDKEQRLLDDLVGQPLCCNVADDSRNPWRNGIPASIQAKIIESNTGQVRSDDFRELRSRLMVGIRRTDDEKRKISESLSGRIRPDEVRLKISEGRKGWNPSDETRRRMSEAKTYRPHNPASIDAMTAAVSKAIMIEGTQYPSSAAASRALGIASTTISQRCGSKTERFKDWYYV